MHSNSSVSNKSWSDSPRTTRNPAVLDPWHNLLRGLVEGFRRARQRRDLSALSDHHLRDIGLSRIEVERELMKPFWEK
jgi:uncharacterized protein YjiS (DUF1127 family)